MHSMLQILVSVKCEARCFDSTSSAAAAQDFLMQKANGTSCTDAIDPLASEPSCLDHASWNCALQQQNRGANEQGCSFFQGENLYSV